MHCWWFLLSQTWNLPSCGGLILTIHFSKINNRLQYHLLNPTHGTVKWLCSIIKLMVLNFRFCCMAAFIWCLLFNWVSEYWVLVWSHRICFTAAGEQAFTIVLKVPINRSPPPKILFGSSDLLFINEGLDNLTYFKVFKVKACFTDCTSHRSLSRLNHIVVVTDVCWWPWTPVAICRAKEAYVTCSFLSCDINILWFGD